LRYPHATQRTHARPIPTRTRSDGRSVRNSTNSGQAPLTCAAETTAFTAGSLVLTLASTVFASRA
jgi:hypothetical protein